MSSPPRAFSDKQGQYLAFIHAYTVVMGRPPAEADLQRQFAVTPPTVHQMVVALTEAGWIKRTPGAARSIHLVVNPADLPALQPPRVQSIRSPVLSY